ISFCTDVFRMLRASRTMARPKSLERLAEAVARSTSKEPPIKGTKTVTTDLAAQLTPSTREAMAAAKEAKKLVKKVTSPEKPVQGMTEENRQPDSLQQDTIQEKMAENGTI
ncbi:hypothetical protein V3C99_010540, partial [Haemonchus contortus]